MIAYCQGPGSACVAESSAETLSAWQSPGLFSPFLFTSFPLYIPLSGLYFLSLMSLVCPSSFSRLPHIFLVCCFPQFFPINPLLSSPPLPSPSCRDCADPLAPPVMLHLSLSSSYLISGGLVESSPLLPLCREWTAGYSAYANSLLATTQSVCVCDREHVCALLFRCVCLWGLWHVYAYICFSFLMAVSTRSPVLLGFFPSGAVIVISWIRCWDISIKLVRWPYCLFGSGVETKVSYHHWRQYLSLIWSYKYHWIILHLTSLAFCPVPLSLSLSLLPSIVCLYSMCLHFGFVHVCFLGWLWQLRGIMLCAHS